MPHPSPNTRGLALLALKQNTNSRQIALSYPVQSPGLILSLLPQQLRPLFGEDSRSCHRNGITFPQGKEGIIVFPLWSKLGCRLGQPTHVADWTNCFK